MSGHLSCLSAFAAASLCAAPALAGTETDRFEPAEQIMLAGFNDTMIDTGWVPSGSPVQLRLQVAAANTIAMSFPGDGVYDWDAETIEFHGDPNAGTFSMDVGVEVHGEVRFDVLGLTWGSDLLGPWDYLIELEEVFTPYLLTGNPDRPVSVSDATDGITVASVPIVPDILVASGNLDIDLAFDVSAELIGRDITAADLGDQATIFSEDNAAGLAPDPASTTPPAAADPLDVDATLTANLKTQTTVIVYPHLVMSILGTDYDIAGIEVPIPLPPIDDDIELPTETLSFDRPADGGDGESGGGSDGSAGIDTGTSGTGDDAGFGGLDDGCNCSARSGSGGGAGGLGLLGAALVFRRRRTTHSRRAR